MNNLETITQKIINEANEKINHNIEKAESEAEQIIKKAAEQAKAKEEALLEKAGAEAKAAGGRILSAARLEARKRILSQKQQLIEAAFVKALVTLRNLDENEYNELISRMSQKAMTDPTVNKDGGQIVTLPKEVGGFIIQNGNIEINCSFEALSKSLREKIEGKVVKTLFG